jgi:apolipoprotein N-acyltransferase
VPLSQSAIGRIARRAFLYVGLALAALAVIGLLVAISVQTGAVFTGGWIGLAIYTSGLFWVTIRQSREYWRRPGFWMVIAGLLVVHLLAFVAILRAYPRWRMVWFMPVVIGEGGLFGAILYLLFADRKRQ